MNEAKIKEWLSSEQPWGEGFKLYFLYGKNNFLKRVFEKGETAQNRVRLAEELEQLLKSPDKLVSESLPLKPKIDEYFTDAEYALLPEKVKNLKREATELKDQRTFLKGRLRDALTVEERKVVAKQILSLKKQANLLWANIDYYKEHGMLPYENEDAFAALDALDNVEMHKRMLNNRGYITKYKKNPEKANQVKQWQAENEEIKRRLKK